MLIHRNHRSKGIAASGRDGFQQTIRGQQGENATVPALKQVTSAGNICGDRLYDRYTLRSWLIIAAPKKSCHLLIYGTYREGGLQPRARRTMLSRRTIARGTYSMSYASNSGRHLDLDLLVPLGLGRSLSGSETGRCGERVHHLLERNILNIRFCYRATGH